MYDNNGRQSFIPNRFHAPSIEPVRIKPKKKPAYIEQIFIGQKEKYYGRLQIYVHEPTLEFPDPTIILQLGSSKSSSFTRISIEDVDNLLTFLKSVKKDLLSVLPELETRASQARDTLDQFENLKRMKAMLIDNNGLDEDVPFNDNDFIENTSATKEY